MKNYARALEKWSSAKFIDLYHFGYNIEIKSGIIPDRI